MPRQQAVSLRNLIDALVEIERTKGPHIEVHVKLDGGMVQPLRPQVMGDIMVTPVDKASRTHVVSNRGVEVVLIRQ